MGRAALFLPVVLGLGSAPALALEIGVEGGVVGTLQSKEPGVDSGPNPESSPLVGVVVEHSFRESAVSLDLWGDLQYPLPISTEYLDLSDYLPVDLGLRIGLVVDRLEPYLGVLGQVAFAARPAGGANDLNPAIVGVGGDLGMDVAFWVLRAGLEARFVEVVTPIHSGPFSEEQVSEFQALLSLRAIVF